MKAIFTLLFLLYCHSSNFLELASKTFNLSWLQNNNQNFSLVSVSNAQALGEQQQQFICNKLRSADFTGDEQVDDADYSLLYLISIKDATALSELNDVGVAVQKLDLLVENKIALDINDEDVSLFYNYLTDALPYCPYLKL